MRTEHVLLVAHGSQDPRAAATTRALARTVAALRPGMDVRVAFLEQCPPTPAEALRAMPSGTIVVPLLLTDAFHGSVDLPAQVAGFDCVVTGTLGAPSEALLTALEQRLPRVWPSDLVPAAKETRFVSAATETRPMIAAIGTRMPFNGLVLAAAGTRVASARGTVEEVAAALSHRLKVPCRVAYAAGATPTGAEAVRSLGKRRVVVASYFLAPGRLHEIVIASALGAGALAAAAPLGASWPLARIILDRIDACSRPAANGSGLEARKWRAAREVTAMDHNVAA